MSCPSALKQSQHGPGYSLWPPESKLQIPASQVLTETPQQSSEHVVTGKVEPPIEATSAIFHTAKTGFDRRADITLCYAK
ncbi:hypothetical protein OK016_21170 [Vibrio chagasii]|nr:hypothetical protein [Vibrio chagasii]